MLRLLIVEDSKQICENIVDYLSKVSGNQVDVTVFNHGSEAITYLKECEEITFDMIYLDIMLPGASGFDICREIRSKSDCPIIFLTALGTEDNILKGYSIGADDYMVKPFSLNQLYAKTLSILRRTRKEQAKVLEYQNIRLDPLSMRVTVDDIEVNLPSKEYFILKLFLENPDRVFTRDNLLTMVWGNDFDGSMRVVDNHINKLRKALGTSGSCIKTYFRRGYKLQ